VTAPGMALQSSMSRSSSGPCSTSPMRKHRGCVRGLQAD
jgi:hypothetical protein